MLPPAPGLFSTTTCWPHISASRAPRMRPMASMPPPGVNGTTSFTTRFGQAPWANAPAGATAGASAEAPTREIRRRRSSMMSPFGLDPGGLDYRPPQVGLGLEVARELLRRRGDDRNAELFELRLDGRLREDRDRVGVKLANDRGRRPGRDEECVPGR